MDPDNNLLHNEFFYITEYEEWWKWFLYEGVGDDEFSPYVVAILNKWLPRPIHRKESGGWSYYSQEFRSRNVYQLEQDLKGFRRS